MFFVISGFLITGDLLGNAETTGNVQFGRFYWNRIRRIVPAATVVLILTYVAAVFAFFPSVRMPWASEDNAGHRRGVEGGGGAVKVKPARRRYRRPFCGASTSPDNRLLLMGQM